MVIIGQPHKYLVSKRLNTGFNIAVFPLRNPNSCCNLLLCQIIILAEVLNTIIYYFSPPT